MSIAESLNRARKARLARIAARAVPQPGLATPSAGRSVRPQQTIDHAYERAWAAAILGTAPVGGHSRVRPRIEDIQRATALHFGLTPEQLLADDRAVFVSRPRQVAMFLSRKLTKASAAEIGRRFAGRDHTSVLHAESRIRDLLAGDAELAESVDRIRAQLNEL